MKSANRNSSILSSRVVVMAFLFIFIAGSFALATVGLRQQIATSGAKAVEMERRLKELDRIDDRFRVEIAMALRPSYLESQNVRLGLGLNQPREDQVIRIDSETQAEFAARRWDQIVSVDESTFPFTMQQSN